MGGVYECYCHLRNVQALLADGKTPYERRFGEPFKRAKNAFLEQMVNITQSQHEIKREFINLARKFHQGIFLRCELVAGRLWKGDILIAEASARNPELPEVGHTGNFLFSSYQRVFRRWSKLLGNSRTQCRLFLGWVSTHLP